MRVGGIALLTNMHPDMGRHAQAGFVDGKGNKVLSGKSWVHGVEETVEEARRVGFEVLGGGEEVVVGEKGKEQEQEVGAEWEAKRERERERARENKEVVNNDGRICVTAKESAAKKEFVRCVREVTVKEDMVEWLGDRSRKWIGMKVWFGVMLRRVS